MVYKIANLAREYWPDQLTQIPKPPAALRYAGAVPDWSRKMLTVVGSRRHSQYGKEATERLLAGLSGEPVTIVSGLAIGIDSIAHRSALECGLPTISVPGSGLSERVLHPKNNIALAHNIVENGGTLLSEFADDSGATLWSFPMRNRIMAGLSDAVLIVEAQRKSGTLITAKLATEYNRDVLALTHSIHNAGGEGPHLLQKLGATPVRTAEDILEALHLRESSREQMSMDIDRYGTCTKDELAVLDILREPLARDDLLRLSPLSIGQTQTILALLELKGLIKETLGEIRQT